MIHGSDDVPDAIGQNRVRAQGIAGSQSTRDGILTQNGTFNRCILRHVADHRGKVGMLYLKLAGVTDERSNGVAAVKCVLNHLTTGRTRCTEYEHLHKLDPVNGCAAERWR